MAANLRDAALKPSNHDERALESVQRILNGLSKQRFYGSVELRFEAGQVVLLRKSETIKPERDNRGDDDGPPR